jgi:hypothetical protein
MRRLIALFVLLFEVSIGAPQAAADSPCEPGTSIPCAIFLGETTAVPDPRPLGTEWYEAWKCHQWISYDGNDRSKVCAVVNIHSLSNWHEGVIVHGVDEIPGGYWCCSDKSYIGYASIYHSGYLIDRNDWNVWNYTDGAYWNRSSDWDKAGGYGPWQGKGTYKVVFPDGSSTGLTLITSTNHYDC